MHEDMTLLQEEPFFHSGYRKPTQLIAGVEQMSTIFLPSEQDSQEKKTSTQMASSFSGYREHYVLSSVDCGSPFLQVIWLQNDKGLLGKHQLEEY